MKKRNLKATFLAFTLCAIMMTGTACAPQVASVDEAKLMAAASIIDEYSLEAEAEETLDVAADNAVDQITEPEQAEAKVEAEDAASTSPKGKSDSADLKPAAKAVSQPVVKESTQNSVATPQKEVELEAAAANLEADPNEGETDDEILMVIDAIPANSEESTAKASTITINGVEIDYVDSYGTASAPSEGAGIWRGSDSTTDGSYGYFIGHDYTEFGDIANLEQGSSVSVTDSNGDSCDYEVVDSFVVPRGTLWSEVSDRVTGHGESIVMQTCVEDGYLIVVAE